MTSRDLTTHDCAIQRTSDGTALLKCPFLFPSLLPPPPSPTSGLHLPHVLHHPLFTRGLSHPPSTTTTTTTFISLLALSRIYIPFPPTMQLNSTLSPLQLNPPHLATLSLSLVISFPLSTTTSPSRVPHFLSGYTASSRLLSLRAVREVTTDILFLLFLQSYLMYIFCFSFTLNMYRVITLNISPLYSRSQKLRCISCMMLL